MLPGGKISACLFVKDRDLAQFFPEQGNVLLFSRTTGALFQSFNSQPHGVIPCYLVIDEKTEKERIIFHHGGFFTYPFSDVILPAGIEYVREFFSDLRRNSIYYRGVWNADAFRVLSNSIIRPAAHGVQSPALQAGQAYLQVFFLARLAVFPEEIGFAKIVCTSIFAIEVAKSRILRRQFFKKVLTFSQGRKDGQFTA